MRPSTGLSMPRHLCNPRSRTHTKIIKSNIILEGALLIPELRGRLRVRIGLRKE